MKCTTFKASILTTSNTRWTNNWVKPNNNWTIGNATNRTRMWNQKASIPFWSMNTKTCNRISTIEHWMCWCRPKLMKTWIRTNISTISLTRLLMPSTKSWVDLINRKYKTKYCKLLLKVWQRDIAIMPMILSCHWSEPKSVKRSRKCRRWVNKSTLLIVIC